MTGHTTGAQPGRVRNWLIDVAIGGVAGVLVSAVVAVNFVIFIGVDRGYEASVGEVFDHSLIGGILTVAILVIGPVVGVVAARRRRSRSDSQRATSPSR